MRKAQIILILMAAITGLLVNGIARPSTNLQLLIGGALLLIVIIAIVLLRNVTRDLAHQLQVKEGQLQGATTKIHQMELKLAELNTTDEVTGCFNRRHFDDLIRRHRGMAERGQYTFSLCATEIDNYSELVELYGNSKGDEILKLTGSIMKSAVREIDSVARIEGARFGIILSGASEGESVEVLTRVNSLIGQIRIAEDQVAVMTASTGVAEFNESLGESDLFQHALDAMQYAINQGRNRVAAHMTASAES